MSHLHQTQLAEDLADSRNQELADDKNQDQVDTRNQDQVDTKNQDQVGNKNQDSNQADIQIGISIVDNQDKMRVKNWNQYHL